MIVLYTFIDKEKHQDILDRYLPVFSGDFQRNILKYRRWEDAQLSLLGRVLLKYGLNKYYNVSEIVIERDLYNKPFLKNHNIHFNISHSNTLVACVLADFPVGIDVEHHNDSIDYFDFKDQMTVNEYQKIMESKERAACLLKLWAEKESIIKAHGGGMAIPLNSFEVVNGECIIAGKKFYTKPIFINENYYSFIAFSVKNLYYASNNFEHVMI